MPSDECATFHALNNEAVALLQTRQLDESVEAMNRALHNLRDSISSRDSPKSSDGVEVVAIPQEPPCLFKVQLLQSNTPTLLGDAPDSSTNVFALYDCAFGFSKTTTSSQELMSAVMLYNFGLALHKRGLAQGKDQDLHKAVKLYHMSMTVISEAPAETPEAKQFALLYMALLTNRGHIHFHFMDTPAVIACCEQLQALLNDHHGLCEEDEFMFFYANILSGLTSIHRTSPAA